MTKKYRPNSNLTLVLIVVVFAAGLSSNPIKNWPLGYYQLVYLVLALGISASIYLTQKLYTYFEIVTTEQGKLLIRRQGLFIKKCPVDSICSIENNNWVIPALLIKFSNVNKHGVLSLTLSAYDTEVVKQLLNDLKAVNSEIQIDEKTEKFLHRK